jgi:hypothetical protein
MRLLLVTVVVCASTLLAGPRTTIEPEAANITRSGPKVAKSSRKFHPLRLLRRLGQAESELGFRLSSRGIQHEVEAARSMKMPHPPMEACASTQAAPLGDHPQGIQTVNPAMP